MPFDQRGECRLGLRGVLPGQEPPQELAIAPFADRAQLVEHPELIGQETGSFTSHRGGPCQPGNRRGRHHKRGARMRGDDSRILSKGPPRREAENPVGRWPQKLPALITSPPALVAIAHQVRGATPSFTKRTEPSRNPTFTPPGWNELAPTQTALHSMGYG